MDSNPISQTWTQLAHHMSSMLVILFACTVPRQLCPKSEFADSVSKQPHQGPAKLVLLFPAQEMSAFQRGYQEHQLWVPAFLCQTCSLMYHTKNRDIPRISQSPSQRPHLHVRQLKVLNNLVHIPGDKPMERVQDLTVQRLGRVAAVSA